MLKLSLSALLLASIVSVAAAQEPATRSAAKPPRADREDTAERDRDSKSERDRDSKSERDRDSKSERDRDSKSERDRDSKSERDRDSKSERDRDSKSESGDVGQEQNMNQMLASCVAIGNQHEIALTQFALAHIEHPEVKKFAQMLHDEHTEFATKLEKDASKEANMTFAAVEKDANRESTRTKQPERKITQAGFKGNEPTDRATDKSAQSGNGHQNHMQTMEREITQKCLMMTEKELTEAKSRGEFDQAFLGCQIAGHIGMIAKLSVFEKEADGELAQVLMDGRAASEKHLAEAKRLMATLSGDAKNTNANKAVDK